MSSKKKGKAPIKWRFCSASWVSRCPLPFRPTAWELAYFYHLGNDQDAIITYERIISRCYPITVHRAVMTELEAMAWWGPDMFNRIINYLAIKDKRPLRPDGQITYANPLEEVEI